MALPELTEKQFQSLVLELATTFGWARYHTHDSRRSQPGFPDLVLVRDRVLFAELKATKGKLSAAQEHWQELLQRAGAYTFVWRPADLPDVSAVLAARVERSAA